MSIEPLFDSPLIQGACMIMADIAATVLAVVVIVVVTAILLALSWWIVQYLVS